MTHRQQLPTFGQLHTSATEGFMLRLWLDCVYDSHAVGVCVSANTCHPPETLSSLRCVCECVCSSYSIRL